ncbi:histidine kinase [Natronococcus pandeyae]|uniref:histidine kinase n=1 Tax=Natronococcus pandeyae TaxID=2055836 RepID=A0A8J8TRN2_9EURY|nr:sensor histidine kinase [Natronococcus pandeyae]TYL37899.1 histidine kinase [Natronococcus pandeyae]
MTDPLALGIGVAVVCTFGLVALLALRHREQPGAVPFVVLTALLAVMAGVVALGRAGILADVRGEFAIFVPFVFASLAWLVLAFEYTGRGPVMTIRRTAALGGFGVAVIGITVFGLVVPEWLFSVWVLVVNVFQFALVAAAGYGAILVARSAISYGDLPLSGSLVLTTAGGGLTAITIVQLFVPAVPLETGFDALQALLAGTAVLLLLAQVRYRVFETGPSAGHLARETVLDEMSASVAITDRDGQVIDLNQTAERTFDVDRSEALGEPIDDAFGIDPDSTDSQPTTIETSDGRREFVVDRLPLTSHGGDPIGRAVLLRDVTDRRTHEQRLEVLNRVLRHNLRNDLDAVRGFAEALERDDETVEPAALAERIHATASEVAELGTALRRAERFLARETVDSEPVDVIGIARRVAADVEARYPGASVAVSAPDSEPELRLRTDRHVLETVLEETVENAVEHNDAADPRVDLGIRRESFGVAIDVADDGPGIPDQERTVLLEGTETPLRHGSGVGLWLVYWGVTRLGGDLEFRENDPRGSVVSIRIPGPSFTGVRE